MSIILQILPKCFFSFLPIIHITLIVKAEPALQWFNMLHLHSKQYLHHLYTRLQALKTLANNQEAIQWGLVASDASDGFSLLIGVRAHCKHVR